MDTEKVIQRLARLKKKDRRFTSWLKLAGINESTFWRWERGKTRPSISALKHLEAVIEYQLRPIKWTNGIPHGFEMQNDALSEYRHARIGVKPSDEVVTLIHRRRYSAAGMYCPSEEVSSGWSIYISRELIDFGDGNERDAELALERILEEQKLTIEE